MKIKDMPPWVLKYKTKGHTIRYQSGKFYLVKVTSVRVKDKPYPKTIQEFIGIITEEDGLIPKKVSPTENSSVSQLEFGLSAFLFTNYKRDMKRHISATDNRELMTMSIVALLVFGDIDNRYLAYTHLPRIARFDSFDGLNDRRLKIVQRIAQRIKDDLDKRIPKQDQIALFADLRNVTLPPHADIYKDVYPQSLKEHIQKWGFRYDTNFD